MVHGTSSGHHAIYSLQKVVGETHKTTWDWRVECRLWRGGTPRGRRRDRQRRHRINRVSPAKHRKTLTKKKYTRRKGRTSHCIPLHLGTLCLFVFIFVDRQTNPNSLFSSSILRSQGRPVNGVYYNHAYIRTHTPDDYHTFLAHCFTFFFFVFFAQQELLQ